MHWRSHGLTVCKPGFAVKWADWAGMGQGTAAVVIDIVYKEAE
jgi:hypothetical protein